MNARSRFAPARQTAVVLRWLVGITLISWRYLWQITPLHRTERAGDESDRPPSLPARHTDEHSQPAESGSGPLFHRLFAVHIDRTPVTAAQLIELLAADLNRGVPSEVAAVRKLHSATNGLAEGDELVVRMPGPWDGPVRVVHRDEHSFRLATLLGHLEAGQIEFSARRDGSGVLMQIETWARPATKLVNVLYTRLRLAKEMQLSMWVRFCLAAATVADGRVNGGVTIDTRALMDRDHAAVQQGGRAG